MKNMMGGIERDEDVNAATKRDQIEDASLAPKAKRAERREMPKPSAFGADTRAYNEAMRQFHIEEETDSTARNRALGRM